MNIPCTHSCWYKECWR